MKTQQLLVENLSSILDNVALCLQQGGVVIVPTETVYGIVTRYDNQEGRERIYRMKQRPQNRQLQMLAADYTSAIQAGVIDTPILKKLVDKLLPGELTLICQGKQEPTIGLRIPNHPFILKLIQKVGFPLAATSANLSGEPPANQASDATLHLAELPDWLIDGGKVQGYSSTVVSLLTDPPTILREGPISLTQILAALNIPHL